MNQWYYVPGSHKTKLRRMTLLARYRRNKRRKKVCDLEAARKWAM